MPKPISRAKRIPQGRRSGFEETLMCQLHSMGQQKGALYEPFFIRYQSHASRRYTPDIVLPNGILIEAKGYFDVGDRTKHLIIQQEHPELDIRFVFQRAKNKLSRTAKMTYGGWCEKHGFLYADKFIPKGWLEEPPQAERLNAIAAVAVHRKSTS